MASHCFKQVPHAGGRQVMPMPASGFGLHLNSQLMRTPCIRTRAAPKEDTGLDDGWGVEVTSSQAVASKSANAPARKSKAKPPPGAKTAGPVAKAVRTRSPFMDMTSEQGILGLTMLQQKLKRAEQGQIGMTATDAQDLIDGLPQIARKAAAKKLVVPVTPAKPKVTVYEDDDGNSWEEAEDEDVTDKPSFELNLDDENMEYIEYDRQGNVINRTAAPAIGDSDGADMEDMDDEDDMEDFDDDDDDDDEFDFSGGEVDGWKAVSSAAGQQEEDGDSGEQLGKMALVAGTPKAASKALTRGRVGRRGMADVREVEEMMGDGGAEDAALMDGDELDEWGLEELGPRPGTQGGRLSLMQELGVIKGSRPRGVDEEMGVNVTWGGNSSSTATDLEEQERLLGRMFKPHKVAKLMAHQRAALVEAEALRRGGSTRGAEARLHRQLRIVSGSAAQKRLLSSQGPQTRPMMEKVRQAIFNILQSQAGTVNCLPAEARWLDLFAGTGSVGLEALSRGCRESHFVEMDPWVTRNILGKNIATCSFQRQSIVHTTKAEEFLKKAVDLPRFAGGAFDFISMCPPYLLVSYPELFDLLNRSQLIHANTLLFVEYPKQLTREVPETVGGLVQVRNRKYGRTHIVVFGPPESVSEEDINDAFDAY